MIPKFLRSDCTIQEAFLPAADVVSFGALSDALGRSQQWELVLEILQACWLNGFNEQMLNGASYYDLLLIYDWYIMIYYWYIIDIWLIYDWYIMIYYWYIIDIWLIYDWYMIDILWYIMIYDWYMIDILLIYDWYIMIYFKSPFWMQTIAKKGCELWPVWWEGKEFKFGRASLQESPSLPALSSSIIAQASGVKTCSGQRFSDYHLDT